MALLRLLQLFSVRRRTQFFLIMLLTLSGAVAELMSIGAVIPFLQIVAAPGSARRIPLLSGMLELVSSLLGSGLVTSAAVLLIVTAAMSALVRILLTYASSRYIYGLTHDLSMLVYSRVIRQPYSLYVQRNSSTVLAGIEKVNIVGGYLISTLLTGLSSLIIMAGIIALLVTVDPLIAFVTGGVIAALYGLIGLITRPLMLRLGRRQATLVTARIKVMQETLGGVRDIILDQSHSAFERQYRALDAATRRLSATSNSLSLSPRFVVEGVGIAMIALLAVHYSGGPGGVAASVPVLGALALGAQRLLPLAQNVNLAWAYYIGTTGQVEDVLELLDAPVLSTQQRALNPTPFNSDIVIKDLSFSYGEGDALSDVNLSISKGGRVGIIGRTGSGKTTLVDVFMGLLRPTSGVILIDGQPLDGGSLENWQAQVAHVPQAIFLLDDTIAANIAFGSSPGQIDMARVCDSARRAHAEFIDDLPGRFNTVVGERGVRLSGGQRQRLGIARALYKRATVLILDEATSALDDATERMVMDGIDQLDRDLTVLIIAHRLSTLTNCDLVVRLENGSIVEQGSYEAVIKRPSHQRSLS